MKVKVLVKTATRSEGELVPFEGHFCIIGRKDADIIVSDMRCSAQHLLLYEGSDFRLWVKDLESTNGTFLNENQVTDSPILIGQEIRIGRTSLVLKDYLSSGKTARDRRPARVEDEDSMDDGHTQVEFMRPLPKLAPKGDPGFVHQWPENRGAPKSDQHIYLDYIDQSGNAARIRLLNLLKRR
jgi:pSer/pThr/pTyr-binding forkhead associated (FHA) protein